jgi:hypothetical protein
MKNLIGQKFNRLTVLEKTEKREHGSIIWKCKCDCGNICEVSSRSLTQNNTKSCGCLNTEKRKQRIDSYNKKNKKFFSGEKINELTLIEETPYREGSNVIWKCLCSCGKECYVNTSNLNKQLSCGHLISRNYKDISNQKFGKLLALEPTLERQNGCVVWKCKCDCGNICYKGSSYLITGVVQSCGCLKSKGEQKIIQILQDNNIPFKTQYYFSDCKNGQHYFYFDFFINNQYLIEYDGIQHYQQTGWEDLEKIKQRDSIKNKYCKDKNISLIRIPYFINDITLQDLQLETSQYIYYRRTIEEDD